MFIISKGLLIMSKGLLQKTQFGIHQEILNSTREPGVRAGGRTPENPKRKLRRAEGRMANFPPIPYPRAHVPGQHRGNDGHNYPSPFAEKPATGTTMVTTIRHTFAI